MMSRCGNKKLTAKLANASIGASHLRDPSLRAILFDTETLTTLLRRRN
jgi:hypothetical protein